MMKRTICIALALILACGASAQPKRRIAEQKAAEQRKNDGLSVRAQLSFPTEEGVNVDAVWRRDVYRELLLSQDENAGLYYPVEPLGSQMNLFTYIFKLFMTGQVPVYEYRLDGNESFTDAAKLKQMAFLDNYHIYYEKTDRGTHIDNSDIPSREVTAYYVKESTYYDQQTATFHTKVLALCPVMEREDDLGGATTKYPLFWVKYEDLAPYLAKQTIMTSNLNNAAVMSVDDYFTKNAYKGRIYKTVNMQGKTLAQDYPSEEAMNKEQKKIENEIKAFEKNMWGDPVKRDSLDSIAKVEKPKGKKVKRTRRSSATGVRAKKSRNKAESSTPAARVTVRRERH